MSLFKKSGVVGLLLLLCIQAQAKVNVLSYDSSIVINEAAINRVALHDVDSILAAHPMIEGKSYRVADTVHLFRDNTFDFYLILGILAAFGLMRFVNPRYFQYLLRAFRSPSFSSNQLKDQIDTATFPNFLMNLFFALSGGAYLYYVFKLNMPQQYAAYSPVLLIGILVVALGGLYIAKFLVMRFSGWIFNVRVIINHYMYNVFLINKVISIALLPFIILLAFAHPDVARPVMIVSVAVVGVLFVNRYVRSWQVLAPFFQYSKFHFFTYLCASELLPMAILTKILIQVMYY